MPQLEGPAQVVAEAEKAPEAPQQQNKQETPPLKTHHETSDINQLSREALMQLVQSQRATITAQQKEIVDLKQGATMSEKENNKRKNPEGEETNHSHALDNTVCKRPKT